MNETKKLRVALFFGGVSSEHEVSCVSASTWLRALAQAPCADRYEVFPVGITKQGRWLACSPTPEAMADGSWEKGADCTPCVLSPDRTDHGIWLLKDGKAELVHIDICAPVMHGKNGEDGTIQGLFELARIPYVGCGVLGSAVCMDKAVANTIMDAAGVPHCKWASAIRAELEGDHKTLLDSIEQRLGYPIFVKPANAGSSVGITKATDRAVLEQAVVTALKEDDKVVFEEFIDGQEVECAAIGNPDDPAIPGWEETIRPAYWDIKLKEIELAPEEKAYGGSVKVTYTYVMADATGTVTWGEKSVTKTYSVENIYDSQATVDQVLNSMITDGIEENRPVSGDSRQWIFSYSTQTPVAYTEVVVTEAVTVKAIESIKYYPAITKSHAPVVVVEKAHTAVKPNYEGKAGDIVGCWQWIAKENTQVVTSHGAYWDFYGVFGDLKLDTANATTDLDYNGGKLPSTVTLTQVGNTVKYENVGTPVGYSYKINIPASIEYGWGVAETTLTITVNPAGAGE